jgi:hypothetical protein
MLMTTVIAFYRQSLQIQHLHAELYHNATALRGIEGPEDVQRMPQAQRDLAIRSIQVARMGLHITINSPAYREGLKYGVCTSVTHLPFVGLIKCCIISGPIYARNCHICGFVPAEARAFIVSFLVYYLVDMIYS